MCKMAVRAFNSVALTELCMRSASRGLSSPSGHIRRVKCDLFGSADSGEISKMINDELEHHQRKAAKRWGFDFRKGCPLSTDKTFSWELVSDEESVCAPQMYTLTRAAHLRPKPREPTATDLLTDKRTRVMYSSSAESSLTSSPDRSLISSACSSPGDASTLIAISNSSISGSTPQRRKRQAKITEFLKERKRLLPAPKKISPAKRMRTSADRSGTATLAAIFAQSPRTKSQVDLQ